jgi:hypothetical protein
MAKSILDVKGIGPASAALLKKAGIETVDKLAEATIAAVSAVQGFGEARAALVIEDAKTLIAPESKPAGGGKNQASKKKPSKPSSKKKKKADSKKKDKKSDKKKSGNKKAKQKSPEKKKKAKKSKKK